MVNPHSTHTKCQHLKFTEAQMWTGVAASTREEGGHLCSHTAWAGCGWWSSHGARARDGARGCPRLCGTGWRTAWRHQSGAARPESELLPCSSGMCNHKEGVWGMFIAHSQATKCRHQSAMTMPTLIHNFPNFTLVSCCMP